jgi:hypothetical protein
MAGDILFDEETKAEKLQIIADKAKENLHLKRMKHVFESKDGLYVLDHILTKCGIKETVFTGNSRTYYNAGKQDIGNDILAEVTIADVNIHHRLIDMWLIEANAKETKEEAK